MRAADASSGSSPRGPPQIFHRAPIGIGAPPFERLALVFPICGGALPADFDGDGRVVS